MNRDVVHDQNLLTQSINLTQDILQTSVHIIFIRDETRTNSHARESLRKFRVIFDRVSTTRTRMNDDSEFPRIARKLKHRSGVVHSFFFLPCSLAKRLRHISQVVNEHNRRCIRAFVVVTLASPTNTFRGKIAINGDLSLVRASSLYRLTACNFVARRKKKRKEDRRRSATCAVSRGSRGSHIREIVPSNERTNERTSRRRRRRGEQRRRPMLFSPLRFLINPSLVG